MATRSWFQNRAFSVPYKWGANKSGENISIPSTYFETVSSVLLFLARKSDFFLQK